MRNHNAIPVTAIFDIGKTNKKFLLFDENYSVVQEQKTTLDETKDDDGDSCENLSLLEHWIKNKIRATYLNDDFRIQSLNFSTYGASLVHLNNKGKVVTPLYNYLKTYPVDLLEQFYDTYSGKKAFSLETASPPMGMLNSGLQLYWLKYKKPLRFKEISHSLHFPQYISYLLTGNFSAELTSIGCHTGLWNYKKETYHRWVKEEDISKLLPGIQPVSAGFDATYEEINSRVGIGIHDSSAALAPFLHALDEPFMLLSTGTWSITFNPFNNEPLTFEELKKDCLCFLDVKANRVKASRLFLGNEYMHQMENLNNHFGRDHHRENLEIEAGLLKKLIKESGPEKKLKLETAYSSGPYPQVRPGKWKIDQFSSYKEAYHQLMLDLVSIQVDCIKLAEGLKKIEKLIITGGFSHNDFFIKLLAFFLPNKKIYTSSLSHASPLGAAVVVNKTDGQKNEKSILKDRLGLTFHAPPQELDTIAYSWKAGDYKEF